MVDTVYESRQIYQPKDIQVGEESVSDIGVFLITSQLISMNL